MKTKILLYSAVVTAFLAVSCNKEAANVADSKANAKTEEVSFSVGISQEETKAFVERESVNTWKVVWNNSDKIWV